MKYLVAALTLAGCTADIPPAGNPPLVAFYGPLIPLCVIGCEVRTADGTTTILRQSAH